MTDKDHKEIELIPQTKCGHFGAVYKRWTRGSTVDWGRRKFREAAILERTFFHMDVSWGPETKETRRSYRLVESEKRFGDLVQQWHDDTWHVSSSSRIISNQHYLTIVAMGPSVLPSILRRLRDNPEPWFPALVAITRENPVPPEDLGSFPRMRDAWLSWGAERGHI